MTAASYAPRAEWHAERAKGIGASEIAALFRDPATGRGRHPYLTEWDLWCRKTGQHTPEPETADQRRGHRWEATILAEYADTRGVYVRPNADVVVGPEDWIRCTPDGFVFPDRFRAQARHRQGLVEVKTARRRDGWADEPTNGVDDVLWHYAAQCLYQLAATGAPWVDLVVMLPYWETRVYRIERDEKAIAGLLAVGREWWKRHVLGGERPAVDGSDACADFLLRQPREGERAATEEEATLAREAADVRAQLRALEERKKALDGQILASMAGAERLTLPGGRVSITERAGSVKWSAVAKEAGATDALIAKFTGAPSRFLDVRVK